MLADKGLLRIFRLMAAEASTYPNIVRGFHEMGPITTGHNVAGSLSRHLPGALDNSGVAAQATFEYLALLRGAYWLESILGTCDGIDAAELDAHLRHCVRQIRRLHEIRAVGSRQGSAHVQQ